MKYSNIIIHTLSASFIAIIVSIILVPRIEAANFDLSVSPQIIQVDLTPPAVAQAKQTITLQNNSDNPLPLSVSLKPFRPDGANGNITYLKDGEHIGNDQDILKKIILSQGNDQVDSIIIPPQSKKQLDLTVNVPNNEPPGDYYVSVVFMQSTGGQSSTLQSTGASAVGGIAMNLILSIGPKGKTTGSIEEFSTPFFQPQGPVSLKVKITNTSSHYIAPKGQIIITNMFGQKIGKIDLLPLNILEHSSRYLPSKEQFVFAANDNPDKNKQITRIQKTLLSDEQALAVWPETFLLGPYKATLTVAFSDEGPLYVKSITFIGVPVYLLVAVGICLLLVLAIRTRLKKRNVIIS